MIAEVATQAHPTHTVTSKGATNMPRLIQAAFASLIAVLLLAAFAGQARADFGIDAFDGAVSNADGSAYTQAGGHPDEAFTAVTFNRHDDSDLGLPLPPGFAQAPDGDLRNVIVDLPSGLVGNPEAFPRCTVAQLVFLEIGQGAIQGRPRCPIASQLGTVRLRMNIENLQPGWTFPLYQMEPANGKVARFAFLAAGTPIFLDASVRQDGTYGLSLGSASRSRR